MAPLARRCRTEPAWEHRVARFVGAAYVAVRTVYSPATASEPDESYLGIAMTLASLVVMPLVSRMGHTGKLDKLGKGQR